MQASRSVFLTGGSGFVGSNFLQIMQNESVTCYTRNTEVIIDHDVVVHLAGKSEDVKRPLNSEEYYKSNTELTKKVFDAFLISRAEVFITLSSVKAVADVIQEELCEDEFPRPKTHYGKSKLLAEQYILSKDVQGNKRVYILRPCLIHGPGNRGNLKLLYKLVSSCIPWPLGKFENRRSYCGIDNLIFVIKELIERRDIPSGVYNVADDVPLSTNEVISILGESLYKEPRIWYISKSVIMFIVKIGSGLNFVMNEERLKKLTESYVVSNKKLMTVIGKSLPLSSREGLLNTFRSFKKN